MGAMLLLAPGLLRAQGHDIRFSVKPLQGDNVTQRDAAVMEHRVKQALGRSYALSDNPYEVFSIRPTLVIDDVMETEGLVREVAVITGDLTLEAVNDIDGTTYHTAVIPLKASATGGKGKALDKLASGLKPTDPVFVRFVRQAREKIDDYYSSNCSKILSIAKNLADTGRGEEALAYLAGVSPSVDCYDMAAVMTVDIAGTLTPTQDIADISGEPTVAVSEEDTPVAAPEPTAPTPIPTPAPAPTPTPVPAPAPEAISPSPAPRAVAVVPDPQVSVGSDDLRFKVLGCTGDKASNRIYIQCQIVNMKRNVERAYCTVQSAIDGTGNPIPHWQVKNIDGYWVGGTAFSTPYDVPVNVMFYLNDFNSLPDVLSYVEFNIGGVKVVVRNLRVNW